VLQPIQLAAIAISTAFQKRRALRQGMSAFIRAAIITSGTCTAVFTARSSVPKANRAPVQIDAIDSLIRRLVLRGMGLQISANVSGHHVSSNASVIIVL
jgi:hypothetical protein